MKKGAPRKMMLSKETLRSLENGSMRGVVGASLQADTCNASCATDVTCVTCGSALACQTNLSNCC